MALEGVRRQSNQVVVDIGKNSILVFSRDNYLISKLSGLPQINSIILSKIDDIANIIDALRKTASFAILIDIDSLPESELLLGNLRDHSCHVPMIACINDTYLDEENLYGSGFNATIKKTDNVRRLETVISNFIPFRAAQ